MVLKIGAEFQSAATPSQELLIKLSALANDGSIITGAGSSKDKNDHNTDDPFGDSIVLFFQQAAFERQMAELSSRLDRMDQTSLFALQEAEENLHELRENTNQDISGRRVYRDGMDGLIYDEEDNIVDDNQIAFKEWDESRPHRDQFIQASGKLEQAVEHRTWVKNQRDNLGSIKTEKDLVSVEAEFDRMEAEIYGDVNTAASQKGSLLSILHLSGQNTYQLRPAELR